MQTHVLNLLFCEFGTYPPMLPMQMQMLNASTERVEMYQIHTNRRQLQFQCYLQIYQVWIWCTTCKMEFVPKESKRNGFAVIENTID